MNKSNVRNRAKCLRLSDWPEPGQQAWASALQPAASVLDDPGPGAHWRPKTRERYQKAYGRWLDYLRSEDLLDAMAVPEARVRPEVVDCYVAALRKQVASFTVWSYLDGLYTVISAMTGDRDWSWLRNVVNRLQRVARPERKLEHRILPAGRIFEAGIQRMSQAERRQPRLPFDQSSWFRDGLQIAFLIARPIRIRNLASIRIGHNLVRLNGGYQLRFPAEETKTARRLEFPLPDALIAFMDRYLDYHRPRLLQGNGSDRLWVSNLGQGMTINSVGARIRKVTEALLGVPISPHLFRKSAATTIAIESPEEIGIVRVILGHSSSRTSERHYIQARTIEASRRFGDNLDRRRRRLLKQFKV